MKDQQPMSHELQSATSTARPPKGLAGRRCLWQASGESDCSLTMEGRRFP